MTTKMIAAHQRLWLLLLITASACEQSEPKPVDVKSAPTPKREKLTSLTEGPRPAAIKGAAVIDTHEFHEKKVADGKWVCIEGTVIRSDELMGAPRVLLACPACDAKLHCEGYELGNFVILEGTRVVIRGEVFHGKNLAESVPVSQTEISAALESEANAEQTEPPKSTAGGTTTESKGNVEGGSPR